MKPLTPEIISPNEALFEDLLEGATVTPDQPPSVDEDDGLDDEDPLVHKLNADALTLNELVQELEKRGLHARGFFTDDAKVLQEKFDEEHEAYVRAKRQEKKEAREAEARNAAARRRRLLLEAKARREREEIERDHRFQSWLRLMEGGLAPPHSRIEVNDITAQSLAKALLSDSTIVCLDVSNLGLSDLAGACLCRALRINRTIVKIELGSNRLGPMTCASLGDALSINDIVEFVSLESNSLTSGGKRNHDCHGIFAIAEMLCKNRTLRHLSLWRCGTGAEAGRAISKSVVVNDVLTCIEVGYNGWGNSEIRLISKKLRANRAKLDAEREAADEAKKEEEKRLDEERRAKIERERIASEEAWIEEEKLRRADDRRADLERLAQERAEEEEARRREEEERLRIEEKKKAEAAKKKKKKGKKGKGTKAKK